MEIGGKVAVTRRERPQWRMAGEKTEERQQPGQWSSPRLELCSVGDWVSTLAGRKSRLGYIQLLILGPTSGDAELRSQHHHFKKLSRVILIFSQDRGPLLQGWEATWGWEAESDMVRLWLQTHDVCRHSHQWRTRAQDWWPGYQPRHVWVIQEKMPD